MRTLKTIAFMVTLAFFMFACKNQTNTQNNTSGQDTTKAEVYAEVELKADISYLSANEKEILKLMFQAGQLMDDIYWLENYGNKDSLLASIQDEKLRKLVAINYGPWDNFNADSVLISGYPAKFPGANFYPHDMTKEEFEASKDANKKSQYTVLVRDEKGQLKSVWYHQFFAKQINEAADLLKKAAVLAEDKGLKKYLELRAEALLTDNYQASDLAWMDMKTSKLDFVVGPIENYTDGMFEYKTAHESFILLKDTVWSKKLAYYTQFLPKMQEEMPVDPKYKKEKPGNDVDLNAYDVLFYGGDCNAGGKTIAINLPNDEQVQLKKGTRKLQLKNAMKAKFDKIVVPISNTLIAADQRQYVTFDAFFANVMFHEVAHGLGIKNVVGKKQTVRDALQNTYSTIEEGKADILGLYIITKLHEMGEMKDQDLKANYVTFLASMIRSIRFGGGEAHGKANMICFNYLVEKQAIKRNSDGTYSVDFEKMQSAANALTNDILVLQGNGDFIAAQKWIADMAIVKDHLKQDLGLLEKVGIPKDIVFKQGPALLGL